jgi:hypothetical protein
VASRVFAGTLIASAILGAAALAVLAFPLRVFRGDATRPPPDVILAGQLIPMGPDGEARALEVIRRYARSTVTLELLRGEAPEKRPLSRAALGLEIDRVRLEALLRQARDPDSAMRRSAAPGQKLVLPIPVVLARGAALASLLKLKDEVDRGPLDARFDLETKRLMPEQAGFLLDVYGTLAALDAAAVSGAADVRAAYDRKLPRLVAAQRGGVSFGEVLGWFETRYAVDKKHEARTFNLRLAASKLDGHVVLPGETFDFNDVVGPRDEPTVTRSRRSSRQGGWSTASAEGRVRSPALHGRGSSRGSTSSSATHTRPSLHQDGSRRDGRLSSDHVRLRNRSTTPSCCTRPFATASCGPRFSDRGARER